MNLRSPAESYIKYLLVHPSKYSDETIEQILQEYGIYSLGPQYLEKLRKKLVVPEVFRPKDPRHGPSLRFLIREGIRTLFHPTPDTKMAMKILERPRAKEFVEAMILSHAPALAISHKVNEDMLPCTPQAIDEYKKHFWNVELLTATQIRTLLQMELDQNISDDDSRMEKDKKRALKKAGYSDPRKIAADLPYSPLTALMSQMRMGLMPNRIELGKIMESARAMGAMKVLEATMYGGPKDSMVAVNFSTVVRNMTEALESVVKPDEHLREQLQAIALRTESTPVPSIHQLSGGHHTVDMQPAELAVPDEPEKPVDRPDK